MVSIAHWWNENYTGSVPQILGKVLNLNKNIYHTYITIAFGNVPALHLQKSAFTFLRISKWKISWKLWSTVPFFMSGWSESMKGPICQRTIDVYSSRTFQTSICCPMYRIERTHQYKKLRLLTTSIWKKFLQWLKQQIIGCCIGTCRDDL